MKTDTIRILRVIEYVGPRGVVEDQVARSLHGQKSLPNGVVIRAATVGAYPEILQDMVSPTVSWSPLSHQQAKDWFLDILNAAGYGGVPHEGVFESEFVDRLRACGVQVDLEKGGR